MAEDLYSVGNRQTLRQLACGMEITLAVKHEPVELGRLTARELEQRTDARHGSKFLPAWTLKRVTDWTEQQVVRQGWRFPLGAHDRVRVRFDGAVGYVKVAARAYNYGSRERTVGVYIPG